MTWRSTAPAARPNQVKELKPDRVGQLWVSDLSYIRVGIGFAYLSVIMDAYSRKIVGWSFHKTLEAKGPVAALEMALKTRGQVDQPLIHHSDRAGRPVPCSVLFGSLCGSAASSEDYH